mmetsp:Transcript_6517/g.8046  ORF Transcript_6517/g.8046 Transcript_6517/m.8046 type:complete len:90 (+) Transcript_6517:59-328(+)
MDTGLKESISRDAKVSDTSNVTVLVDGLLLMPTSYTNKTVKNVNIQPYPSSCGCRKTSGILQKWKKQRNLTIIAAVKLASSARVMPEEL